ncbi:MAG: RDD family protein [Myxococcota bacterium]
MGCPECGTLNPPGAARCRRCRALLLQNPQPSAPAESRGRIDVLSRENVPSQPNASSGVDAPEKRKPLWEESSSPEDSGPLGGNALEPGSSQKTRRERLQTASLTRRSTGLLIDGLMVGTWVWALVAAGCFGPEPLNANWMEPDDWLPMIRSGTLVAILATAALLGTAYVVVVHGLTGTSFGKFAVGCRVHHVAGKKLTWKLIGLRGALAMLGTLAFGVGPAWILLTKRQRALHDLLTGTIVARGDRRGV